MSFEFWYRWLLIVSIFFALVGLYIAFLPEGWVLTPWNEAAEREFFEGNPTVEATAFKSFLFGPLGATIAGFYVLQVFVVWNAFGRKERWAWWAIAAGTLVWFAVFRIQWRGRSGRPVPPFSSPGVLPFLPGFLRAEFPFCGLWLSRDSGRGVEGPQPCPFRP